MLSGWIIYRYAIMITEGDSFILCITFFFMRPGSSSSDIQGHVPPWERSPPHGSRRGYAWGLGSEGGSGRSLQGRPGRWCHGVPKALKSETRLCGDKLPCTSCQTQHPHAWDAYTRSPQECPTVWPRGGAVEKARVRLSINSSVWADVQYFTVL